MAATPYIAAPFIAFGVAPRLLSDTLSRIVTFDRAEASFANITQTNMVRVSSFCGPYGLLWGYDLLPQALSPSELLPLEPDTYSAEPLFEATQALLGTITAPRFPILPGQHLLCAYKAFHAAGPCRMYGAMAIGIAEDRSRNADLFMEDHGVLDECGDDFTQRQRVAHDLVQSARRVGENVGVAYRQVLLSVQTATVPEGQTGCALTAAPYLHLARNAVPEEGPQSLLHLTLREWEERVVSRTEGGASSRQ